MGLAPQTELSHAQIGSLACEPSGQTRNRGLEGIEPAFVVADDLEHAATDAGGPGTARDCLASNATPGRRQHEFRAARAG